MSTKRTLKREPSARRNRRASKSKGTKRIAERTISKKQEPTADELILRAWEKTYANRHHRLDG